MSTDTAEDRAAATETGPVTAAERIEVIDVLRGWALLGILLVNMTMDLPWVRLVPQLTERPWIDRSLYIFIDILAEGKFYVLFSFLFGLGFAIQMNRAEERGRRLVVTYSRRLLALYVIGLVLTLLTGEGQLRVYATLGFLLLLLRQVPRRLLPAIAIACLLYPPLTEFFAAWERRDDAGAVSAYSQQQNDALSARTRRQEQRIQIYSTGTFRQIVDAHTPGFWSWSWVSGEFPFLLLGLYVGRRRIFENVISHLSWFRKVARWGLAIGLAGSVLAHVIFERRQIWAFDSPAWWTRELAELLDRVASPALAFGYAAAIVLLFTQGRWLKLLKPLAPVGRMALTNYIVQWLAFMFLTFSFGLGLYGRFTFGAGLLVAVTLFALQVLFSAWFLKRFRFGPAEWLWRSATYWRWQPLRVRPAPVADVGNR